MNLIRVFNRRYLCPSEIREDLQKLVWIEKDLPNREDQGLSLSLLPGPESHNTPLMIQPTDRKIARKETIRGHEGPTKLLTNSIIIIKGPFLIGYV